MSLKDTLKKKTLEAEARDRQRMPTMYRTAYHRFFEGYSEVLEEDERGRRHIRRVYTGKYYEPVSSPARRTVIKAGYSAAAICSDVLVLLAGAKDTAANRTPIANLPFMLSLAALFWVCASVLTYLFTKRRMTIHEYKSSSRSVKRSTLAASIALSASALTALLFPVLGLESVPSAGYLCAGELAASAALMFAVNRTEYSEKYSEIKNEISLPDSALIE